MRLHGFSDKQVVALTVLEALGSSNASYGTELYPTFSNAYFANLLKYRQAEPSRSLPSDAFLLSDEAKYKEHIQTFATDRAELFKVFHDAFIHMSRLGYAPKLLRSPEDYLAVCEIRNP